MINVRATDYRIDESLGTPIMPVGTRRLAVGRAMTLSDFFRAFDAISLEAGGVQKLIILAHGAPVTSPARIQFCQEQLDIGNVRRMSHLNGKVRKIKFESCSAASELNGGAEFCAELARITNANVVASRDVQSRTVPLCYPRWEGTVVLFAAGTGLSRVVRESDERFADVCPDIAFESDRPARMIPVPGR